MIIEKYYGPPGTGKTTTALNLLSKELETIAPNRIAYVTFTRSGRDEAKKRILERFDITEKDIPYVATIHKICKDQLNIESSQIVNDKLLAELGEILGYELKSVKMGADGLPIYGEKTTEADLAFQAIDICRKRGFAETQMFTVYADQYDGTWTKPHFEHLIRNMRLWKEQNGYYDFTDFLYRYIKEGIPLPIDVMFVDEAQDLSKAEAKAVMKMADNAERIYIFGDDDQSIYRFSGAEASIFLNWECDKEHVLSKSYRLSDRIKDHSQRIIRQVSERKDKRFESTGQVGTVDEVDDFLDGISGSTFLLYRNRFLAGRYAGILKYQGFPYIGAGSPLDSKKLIRCVSNWMLLQGGESIRMADVIEMLDFIPVHQSQYIKRGVKKQLKDTADRTRWVQLADMPDIGFTNTEGKRWSSVLSNIPAIEYLMSIEDKYGATGLLETPQLELLTIHQSKGREADSVIISPDMAGRSYLDYSNNPDDEHRLRYVGATRAKTNLVLLNPTMRYFYENVI